MSSNNINRRLNGLSPLAYLGVEPSSPPQLVQEIRRPTVNDYQNYTVGTIWLVKDTEEIWMLVAKSNNIANWTLTTSGDLTFLADDGNSAHPALGVVHILGGPNIDTTAVPNGSHFLQVGLQNDVNIPGNLNVATLIPGGVVSADGAGLLSVSNGADGQVLVGGAAAPAWVTPISGNATIDFSFSGPNVLDIRVAAGAVGFGGLIDEAANIAVPDVNHRVTLDAGYMIATDATIAPSVVRISLLDAPAAANVQFVYSAAADTVPSWGYSR